MSWRFKFKTNSEEDVTVVLEAHLQLVNTFLRIYENNKVISHSGQGQIAYRDDIGLDQTVDVKKRKQRDLSLDLLAYNILIGLLCDKNNTEEIYKGLKDIEEAATQEPVIKPAWRTFGNRVWECGGLLATHDHRKGLENCSKLDKVLKYCFLFEVSSVEAVGFKACEKDRTEVLLQAESSSDEFKGN
uniref:Pentatricopeptide repeat-containing protein, mitochondrial n=1 Tax=Noccaea caerulescens TaxID=107243 RepID=A0A1J3CAS5_NOCCA